MSGKRRSYPNFQFEKVKYLYSQVTPRITAQEDLHLSTALQVGSTLVQLDDRRKLTFCRENTKLYDENYAAKCNRTLTVVSCQNTRRNVKEVS